VRPRVLFLTTRFPFPPDRGDRLHAFHLLRVLAERFDVTLAAFDEGESGSAGASVFEGLGVRVRTVPLSRFARLARLGGALVTGEPLQIAYYRDEAMRRLVASSLPAGQSYDAVVCHLVRTAPYAAAAPTRVRLLSLCDSMALGLERRMRHAPWLERPSIGLEHARMRRFESSVLDDFDEGWLVSGVDLAEFPGDTRKIRVIPNGVDARLLEGDIPEDPPSVIGFHGHFRVPHNVDAAGFLVREVLPRLRARGIETKVRFLGADPAPAVRALASVPGVEVRGYVEDLRSVLQEYRVLCAPLRFSAGIQNKLIEALAAGVPVVSATSAIEALGGAPSSIAQGADDPEAYAAAIAQQWARGEERMHALVAAREWVRLQFRWENFADRVSAWIAGTGGATGPVRQS
jgi:glycosyltransferase involved in cell wall biosynthesis